MPIRNTTIHTAGVDPMVVALRREQVRQGLSDYALAPLAGMRPSQLGPIWRGAQKPMMPTLRRIEAALQKGNTAFKLDKAAAKERVGG